ncbi:glycosyltransferase family 2 protein [Pseudoalteromonas sp. G4]|uniref:glycosyltransferase family 2 protein n=1 Tax=Pseudoalteromonas sp. G4 TaxID=2992761 RepID=UPI00237E35DB|nr:glycosyltransferase [Pseudoalteromonas sp. G4]MDE3271257.1 glycosyltransferase [Pseudoalteromonas sp. G4]
MSASKNCQLTVGVYIPTKNRLELLKKALDSVLQQTYQHFKVCIVDDGSTDGTFEYLSSLSHPSITFIRNEQSIGACAARNKAIESLDTDLVTGLDDDDVFLPTRLEDLIQIYDEKFAFVCSGYFWDYGAHKKSLFAKNKVISLSNALDLNQCSNQILVNRERVLSVNGFDPKLPALQDHDLWVRLIAKYGDAYRLGKELYIVNDDRELERISSVQNKLNAIDLFERKHHAIMSKRNMENFSFYRKKIKGDKISFLELLTSSKYGLSNLKMRHAFSQSLESLSKLRLDYMAHGKVEHMKMNWLLTVFAPLLATGGPGASRVILLSSCIFFLGASNTASFGSDFFILMLLNTAFSQSYGFFVLKQAYLNSFKGILKQSLVGLLASSLILIGLFLAGIISNLYFTLMLLGVLHFYYVYRFKRIANHGFVILAIAECMVSLSCLLLPAFMAFNEVEHPNAPYIVYVIACFIGLVVVVALDDKPSNSESTRIPIKKVGNIAVSTTASIFAVFCFPFISKEIFAPETASYVALAISCFSIAMLIPRTYANKSMKTMADEALDWGQLSKINALYSKIIWFSCFGGLFFTALYLTVLNVEWEMAVAIPSMIMLIFVCSQYGFANLTSLSLHGEEASVAKLNLFVLLITLTVLCLLSVGIINQSNLYLIMPILCGSFVFRNYKAKNLALGKF